MMDLKKSILLLFICGVFGDEVKTVMEGDSVTLNSDLTDIKKYWLKSWKIGDELIAQISEDKISYKNGSDGSFRDRLQLDSETASLTVTNMRMKHSGLYNLEAFSSSSSSPPISKKFTVSVYESPAAITVGEVEIKSVSVTEGDSLTLQTDVLQPRDELIVWRFGDEGKLIAKADLEANINSYIDIDERFRDRLKLNQQNGSLTISNMRIADSGLYIVKISSSKQTLHKKFIVTVIDPVWSSGEVTGVAAGVAAAVVVLFAAAGFLYYRWKKGEEKKVIVKDGDSDTLPTGVTELQTNDEIQWWYGAENILIAELTGGEGKTYDGDDERFSGKLTLDKNTGDLNISDIKIIHSGLYKLKITRKRRIIPRHKRFILTVETVTGEEKVIVKEGDPVTLDTGDTKLHTDDKVQWWYGAENNLIAELTGGKEQTHDVVDERFSDKLRLDKKTGNLNISNIKIIHSGLYKLKITRKGGTIPRPKRFILTVNLNTVQKTVGDDLTLLIPTEADLQKDDLILWKFGPKGSVIATFSRVLNKKPTYDDPHERFKDRLKLEEETGFLTITNITTEHAGVYELQLSNGKRTTNRKHRVTVTGTAGEVTGKKPIELKADSTENGASESTTVVTPFLSEKQQSSV